MKFTRDTSSGNRRRQRPRSSHSQPYLGRQSRNGVAIQCQFCSGQQFRRSTLRSQDFGELFLMRYPVRCLRCSARQQVSFAIASISLSSGSRPPRHRRSSSSETHWKEPVPHPSAIHSTPEAHADEAGR